MAHFEVVSKYSPQDDINIPVRSTKGSAGYDFEAAADIVIPSYYKLQNTLAEAFIKQGNSPDGEYWPSYNLDEMKKIVKENKAGPTLVPTGIKCKLDPGTYLELSVRSSSPLKYWLVLANGVGIIDADYYNNPDNEGEIFFQLINLSICDLQIHKGDRLGQGIIKPYLTTDDDAACGQRTGGFGSTNS